MTNYSTPKLLSFIALALVCQIGSVQAQEVGKVISSTPVIQQVAVPRQVCTTEQIVVQGQKSGAGAAMGAMGGFGLSLCVPLVAPVVVPLALLRVAREQDREGKQLEHAAQPA